MADASPRYAERLGVPWLWWVLGAGLVTGVWWSFYVATPPAATWVATAVAAAVVVITLSRYGSLRVAVADDELLVGRAHVPLRFVGTVAPLDADAVRRVMGVDADARAYVAYRSYCPAAVKVEIVDSRDPTPYWLVSTRHPEALSRALGGSPVQD
jgi:hypothetical protein